MWGIVGIIIGLAVAAMSVAAPFVFQGLQFIAVPLFILGAVVAVGAIGFGIWWTIRNRKESSPSSLGSEPNLIY